ncbi:hypothetical protein A3742_09725 [Oleiphilus sp. HI0071]|uniref:DNA replication/repair protein RecF n=2 Tax=unclassified Oleiphilus TaxID=2631174 RepID=UPI0007C20FC3|nr:DNA replication/repair protein RecF [Oleiphilus sp. HI0079]KZY68098.1 hypothetical protein A3737_01890 [Oleiphilus sp. HI0065]KZY82275.1 hypothetical protein A3742_18525 [Oleiphilus sp. HI0071]KZZ01406.1 hypothetical protein A3744_11475 [Oleiphilus sp. HI0073]KZZ51684.1 hypothetical protein A3760_12480 [Oleiphilus sp. HI0122]KZZ54855.1 hypothetical protein A3758_00975 [Oleiphilus sp. HI0118]
MLQELFISGFRNLDVQTLQLDANFVVLLGSNASGKTSFLESIYTLLNGKSFRTSKTKNIISNIGSYEEFVLRGVICGVGRAGNGRRVIALKKSISDRYVAKIDGEHAASIAEIAWVLPTQIVEPRSFNLLEGGASSRRRLFDWLVFHVEHSFGDVWKRYTGVLKQRAALLKQSRPDEQLIAVWDQQLAELGERIHCLRAPIIERVIETFWLRASRLFGEEVLERLQVSYSRGWSNSESLFDSLIASRGKDIKRRTTHYGAHRADLKFSYDGLPVQEGLSRGQQKLLVLALHLAQIEVLYGATDKACMLLLDDLASELDEANLEVLLGQLQGLETCVIATGLDHSLYERLISKLDLSHKTRMFHVEHGKITPLIH